MALRFWRWRRVAWASRRCFRLSVTQHLESTLTTFNYPVRTSVPRDAGWPDGRDRENRLRGRGRGRRGREWSGALLYFSVPFYFFRPLRPWPWSSSFLFHRPSALNRLSKSWPVPLPGELLPEHTPNLHCSNAIERSPRRITPHPRV